MVSQAPLPEASEPVRRDRLELRRFNTFTNDVIFVDGLWGTGKSLVAPLISGMSGVEKQRFDHAFEWLCTLRHLGRIEHDAALALLQNYADLDQYNNLVGREVNLRWADESGSNANPNWLRYVRRLFGPDGDGIVTRIESENLALTVTSHMILLVADPLFAAFGRRLKLVEIVRHPLYVVNHWAAFLDRYDGKRIFNLALDHRGQKVPWFAEQWADEYVALSTVDRAIASIVRLYRDLFRAIDQRQHCREQLLVESFEGVAFETQRFLANLASFLGREHSKRLPQILRRAKLPRQQILHGKGKAQYGWTGRHHRSEREDYEAMLSQVRSAASDLYVAQLGATISEYNRRWPSILNQFHSSSS